MLADDIALRRSAESESLQGYKHVAALRPNYDLR